MNLIAICVDWRLSAVLFPASFQAWETQYSFYERYLCLSTDLRQSFCRFFEQLNVEFTQLMRYTIPAELLLYTHSCLLTQLICPVWVGENAVNCSGKGSFILWCC